MPTSIQYGLDSADVTVWPGSLGDRVFELTVEDPAGNQDSALVAISVVNATLDATLPISLNTEVNQPLAIEAIVTSGGGFAPVYNWAVVNQPNGAAAALTPRDRAATSFEASVRGNYVVHFEARIGAVAVTRTVAISVTGGVRTLPFVASDIRYSRALDRFVAPDPISSRLHVFDPESLTTNSISIPSGAYSIGISPDGLRGVVGYDGSIAIYQLEPLGFLGIYPVGAFPFSIVVDATNRAHLFDRYAASPVRTVALDTGAVASATVELPAQSVGMLHPAFSNAMYVSPPPTPGGVQLARYQVGQSPAMEVKQVTDPGNVTPCAWFWFLRGGQEVITRCGVRWALNAATSSDLVPIETLPSTEILWGDEASSRGLFAAAVRTNGGDVRLRLYRSQPFGYLTELPLETVELPSQTIAVPPFFVSFRSDEERLYAVGIHEGTFYLWRLSI